MIFSATAARSRVRIEHSRSRLVVTPPRQELDNLDVPDLLPPPQDPRALLADRPALEKTLVLRQVQNVRGRDLAGSGNRQPLAR